ncbi:hypothetical protein [Metallosphaera hakonensis]|uniref:hypothetical protein n=1 Tax=Metallosphaera hakonensis TaxID=79601 RepID=UPI0014431761|nr:hypothetical protein [Metallosphaera hakonensis]
MWYASAPMSDSPGVTFTSGSCDPQMWSSAPCLRQGGAERQEIPTARWEVPSVRSGGVH